MSKTLGEKRETFFAIVFSEIPLRFFGKSSLLQFKIDPGNMAGVSSFFVGGEKIRHYFQEFVSLRLM